MNELQMIIDHYLNFCQYQKRLDSKTLKAYRIDLRQFLEKVPAKHPSDITPILLEAYITDLHANYKPKTAKRKIASLKTFFHYLEYRDIILFNPFNKLQIKFREPIILPKTIPMHTLEHFMSILYAEKNKDHSTYRKKCILRDIAVVELLFATGVRISELCSLRPCDVDLEDMAILIYGKGAKERKIPLGYDAVIYALKEYEAAFYTDMKACGYFFVNERNSRLSEQSVRQMIDHYVSTASIEMHITPHMFRHTFATCLLEADVDTRCIQELLGHSSISVTEIYTRVTISKQKDILTTKHPRKDFGF